MHGGYALHRAADTVEDEPPVDLDRRNASHTYHLTGNLRLGPSAVKKVSAMIHFPGRLESEPERAVRAAAMGLSRECLCRVRGLRSVVRPAAVLW